MEENVKAMLQDIYCMANRLSSVTEKITDEQAEIIYESWSRLNVLDSDLFL